MAVKFFFFAAVVAVANTGIAPQQGLGSAAPVAKHAATVATDYDSHPQYHFNYDVQNFLDKDFKSHEELRDGDSVKGYYSVVEPDNYRRVVDYTVDPHSGFKAVVHRIPFVLDPIDPLFSRPFYHTPITNVDSPLGDQQSHHH